MNPTSSEENWQLLKKGINTLDLTKTYTPSYLFCLPNSLSFDQLLLKNLRYFLKFVEQQEKNPVEKKMVISGALSFFHYQKGGWKGVVSGSVFASSLTSMVERSREIKKASLNKFATFIKDNENKIFYRNDDNLIYLFDMESAFNIQQKVCEQLKEIESEGISSKLLKFSPFS